MFAIAVSSLTPGVAVGQERDDAKPAVPAGDLATASVEGLARQVRPSIAVVTVAGRDGRQQGLGTGFVVDAAGLVATNLHVAGEGRPLSVQFADGSRHEVIEITAFDRASDLAILRIAKPDKPLVPLELGRSADPPDGLPVVTVGNPHGLTFSVVGGVVSGVREVEGRPMIQLAMPIEPGNSGGPVVDPGGKVIGVVTIKSLVTKNLGFAVRVAALKPLLEKPNPVPMSRWLTMGRLDPARWTALFGARWQQRGGLIAVSGSGAGFGGRSLCLAERQPPAAPFDLAVSVKLDDEAGAAGLAFHADGGDRHYGFYPTGGKLRVVRFDGPTVLQWQVLREVAAPRYRPGEWNRLVVRVGEGRFTCHVNDEEVAAVTDDGLAAGKVGLVKFRDTEAVFRSFHVGGAGTAGGPDAAVADRLGKAIDALPALERATPATLAPLTAEAAPAADALRERALELERRSADLRRLAADVRTAAAAARLGAEAAKGEECDLLRAALLIALLDDEDLDVDSYMEQVERMAREITATLPADADDTARREALDRHLFAENGFHGSRTDYYHAANSHMSRVIDDREGLPITLSILYMELARRIGIDVVGIGLPGHFVVEHRPKQGEPRLIDVFDRGAHLSREGAAAKVRENSGEELRPDHLQPAGRRQILQRVLRNLLGVAREGRDREAVLRYLEALVAVAPDEARDRGLLAVARFEAGRREAAIEAMDWFLANQPPGIDVEQIGELKRRFREAPIPPR
jgi:serine protease Do